MLLNFGGVPHDSGHGLSGSGDPSEVLFCADRRSVADFGGAGSAAPSLQGLPHWKSLDVKKPFLY